MSLPEVSRSNVVAAIEDIRRGVTHDFGKPTKYLLLYEGEEFAPKAVVGLAAKHATGRALGPYDFSGGEARGRPNEILRSLGFEVIEKRNRRNPAWTRDELILALDLYFRVGRKHEGPSHPDVVALSAELNRLPIHDQKGGATFRNPSGVAMKLGNFLAHDPDYPGTGLARGNRLEVEVWDEFAGDLERLGAVAAAIVAAGPEAAEAPAAEEGDDEAVEGAVLMRVHKGRERDRGLVKRKKEAVLRKTGRLACEACGFNFSDVYGDLGQGFAECHHVKPLADLAEKTTTRLTDLAILCANCHRMIHKTRPLEGVETFRGRLH